MQPPGEEPLLALAAEAIAGSDRTHPADGVLRLLLKRRGALAPAESARVTRAVFAYFRWLGWLDPALPLPQRVAQALQQAGRFERDPGRFPDADLVARAIPEWTGHEVAVAAAWVRSLQGEPRLWLRAKRGQGPALADRLSHCRIFGEGPFADTLEYEGPEDLFRSPEFHAGEFEVQDLSSQAVGLICGPRPGETWWDACAGEGGKTLHLSDLMENKGMIWATDRADWRLQRLKRRAGRARVFNYRSALWQAGPGLPTRTRFDGVLVDAPCSGVGTWQRNPHARWTTEPRDVQELAAVQKDLLSRAGTAVKPGGRLIYSVCTLTRSETVEVADAFEAQAAGFEPLRFVNPLSSGAPPQARLTLWPQEFGGNGMFIAAWTRR